MLALFGDAGRKEVERNKQFLTGVTRGSKIDSMQAISKAIELVGLKYLADELGVTYQAIRKWEKSRVPAERCRAVAKATGNRVTIQELRPDLFLAPDSDNKDAA